MAHSGRGTIGVRLIHTCSTGSGPRRSCSDERARVDPGVFIRSIHRGHLGGLSRATADAALVPDAAGKIVIIETVGSAGRSRHHPDADISVVTLVPGTG